MMLACSGLRVLDFTRGMHGNLVSTILADYGAEVVKIEPPSGDPYRGRPAWGFWNRGKGSRVLDLKSEAGRATARELVATADVLIENFRPGVMTRLGLGYEDARELNPALVYGSITGFGARGPWAHLKGYEGIVSALTGRMLEFSSLLPERGGPVFAAVPSASYGALHAALQGILAALHVRRQTNRGTHVETSLLQGTTAYDMLRWFALQAAGADPLAADRLGSWGAIQHQIPRPNYLTAVTRDGVWLQFANTLPHLFMAQMNALGLTDLYSEPRFADLPALKDARDSEDVWEAVLERVRQRTWAEWKPIFDAERDIAIEPLFEAPDAFDHPQVRHNEHIIEIDGVEQVGPIVRQTETPAAPDRGAPSLGSANGIDAGSWTAVQPGEPGPAPAAPLEGTLVVDFSTFYATPFGSALLADLGARVIKVEPPEGEVSRYTAGRMLFYKTTGGKESIGVNLKTAEGQQIIHRLLARADVVMHNFRPGVAERLGIGYEQARDLNPRVVYHYGASYGDSGPYSYKPAMHPIAGALGGGAIQQMPPSELHADDAELPMDELKRKAWRLMNANEGNPDVNAALGLGSSLLLGLRVAEELGVGQYQLTTMIASNLYANADGAVRGPDVPRRQQPDADLLGQGPLYRLYRTADDAWVFLAAPFEPEWRALCAELGREEWLADPRFASADAREQHGEALAAALAEAFLGRGADEWERDLAARDVACVRADAANVAEFAGNEANRELGFTVDVSHPTFGEYWRHGPIVTLDSAPATIGPACEPGEHTRPILEELGYAPAEIDGFKEAGIVGWPDEGGEDAAALAAEERQREKLAAARPRG
ncbi:MAG: hypothetical protein F4X76_10315 [Chloroflexi bacterium]|nr:hypothetical protein [Chloroflexota bacterium]